MRGSDADWPAAAVPDAPASRTGGSRMLLDELLARREGPSADEPAPTLTIEPVAVPTTGEVGRRAARQRLAQLEDAARRNLRSAEEARRVLLQEHERLREESSARRAAQDEANALRRELERLRTADERRVARDKTRAARAARQEIAAEIKRFHEEHDRVVHELDQLRGALDDHDGLLDEYTQRLREEQQLRAAMREELDKAETERRLAQSALERATETARRHAEDELIQLATAEAALADARSDVERLSAQLADLTAGDGAIGCLQQQVDAHVEEIVQLQNTIADFTARAESAERERDAAIKSRDTADAARAKAERLKLDAERGRVDGESALDAAHARIAELEAALSNAEAQVVRACADGDRLRAHAAALGDELTAVRAEVADLQAAACAPTPEADEGDAPATSPASVDVPPPLARRTPRNERGADAPPAPYAPLPVRRAPRSVEVIAAADGPALDPELVPAPDGFRRTAMAELTAIASSNDDFTFRKQ